MIPRRSADTNCEELAQLKRMCRQPSLASEDRLSAWEAEVARYVGVPHAAAVASGRKGMYLTFKYLGIGPGDEVIVPGYTLGALIPLIQSLNAQPVPADIDPNGFNVTADSVAARITPKTKAILVLHIFGSPCPVADIKALADKAGIPVIEDCAHSLGATHAGRQTGSFGQAGFYSFETTKPVNTFGGGMVVSHDAQLVESIRNATRDDPLDAQPLAKKAKAVSLERTLFATGLAWPMLYLLTSETFKTGITKVYRRVQSAPPAHVGYSPIQAELGLKKLASLEHRLSLRREMAELYRTLLRPDIVPQEVSKDNMATWYFFVATLPCDARDVRRKLLLRGIDAGIEDEIADDCATLLGYRDCRYVESVFRTAIALPMYETLTHRAITRVAQTLNKLVPRKVFARK